MASTSMGSVCMESTSIGSYELVPYGKVEVRVVCLNDLGVSAMFVAIFIASSRVSG